jgi:outer membrane lipoprotein-sorting protein
MSIGIQVSVLADALYTHRKTWGLLPFLFSIVFLFSFLGAAAQQNGSSPAPSLTLDQVVTRLEQNNAKRAAALEQFESKRIYRMEYHGFFRDGSAEMVVRARFTAPNSKQFTIVSQTGSSFVIDHVFKRLLEGEQQAAENLGGIAVTRENYTFRTAGYENTPQGACYVLTLSPKTRNKYLYRGKIWVDDKDFAVVRIEGEPGRNPSMWITKTDFEHTYEKIDDFWLPSENHTESFVRLGGRSTLSIEYQDYRILKAYPLHEIENARIMPVPH